MSTPASAAVRAIRALVFDFDGTILDTETPEYLAWRAEYEARGVELPLPLWASAIGRGREQEEFEPYPYLERRLGHPVDQDALRASRRARFYELLATETVRPGVAEYLREAKERGLRLAVASSSDREWVEGNLLRLGLLDLFDLTRCADDVTRTKPDPELYVSACAGLGVTPDEAVAIEDSPNGCRAAKAAGLFCVAVPNPMTAALSFDHADLVLPSLADRSLSEVLALAAGRPRT